MHDNTLKVLSPLKYTASFPPVINARAFGQKYMNNFNCINTICRNVLFSF